jgi:hypothetical protein
MLRKHQPEQNVVRAAVRLLRAGLEVQLRKHRAMCSMQCAAFNVQHVLS